MRSLIALALLALAVPATAQVAGSPGPGASPPGPEAAPAQVPIPANVRVTARIVVVDREALTRAGLAYAVIGNDRVRVTGSGRAGGRGVGLDVGTHGVTAFLEAARRNRWIRSESTQQVLALSGRDAVVASQQLAAGGHAARTRGPVLAVTPSVLRDGRVHLRVSTRLEDAVSYGWGHGVDGSPAAVDTEVLALPGEELIVASSSSVESSRDAGLLSWGASEHGRDVLISLSATVLSP